MMQILANHVIRANQQSGSCAVESPQSPDSPTTMLYYVHQTLFFPCPHTKERKESGYTRLDYYIRLEIVIPLNMFSRNQPCYCIYGQNVLRGYFQG